MCGSGVIFMLSKKETPNRKQQVVSINAENKTYSYSKGNVSLKFTLRTDIKSELKDFESCLERALDEVREDIKK